jgi:hypothetical protein
MSGLPHRTALRFFAAVVLAASPGVTTAQTADPATRAEAIAQEQAVKVQSLTPQTPHRAEAIFTRANQALTRGGSHWYPFFQSSYSGGGLPIGAGYAKFVSRYNTVDARASITPTGYKRAEAEFLAPRIFDRRGTLSVIGGWREATRVPFYGLGADSAQDRQASYGFKQSFGSGLLTIFPTRRLLMLRGGVEYSQWKQEPGGGSHPSVETLFTPRTLPGLGATIDYLHTQIGVGLDYRPSPFYARRGGFVGVTLHQYADRDDRFGFREVDYEAIQHIPILREAWVVSLRARAITSSGAGAQSIPFFMTPYLGSGSTLRAYQTKRFRGDNTLLLQAEWRIMINRFMETALFYDAGKAAEHRADLNFDDLHTDYGAGFRLHSPFRTLLRVDVARGREGTRFVMGVEPVF